MKRIALLSPLVVGSGSTTLNITKR